MSEIKLYGNIEDESWFDDDITLQKVNSMLESIDKTEDLLVRINTFGGSVDAGFSIYAALRRFGKENNIKITTRQDGYFASIGTVVFLAGDNRIGNKWSEPFVHNAWTMAIGDSGQMLKIAADLESCNDKIARFYSERTSMPYEQARQYMTEETFIPAEKCLEYGVYTELEDLEGVYMRYNNNKQIKKEMKKEEIDEAVDTRMTTWFDKIMAKIFPEKKILNILLTTGEGTQIEFPEVQEGETPAVGNVAKNADGSIPNGEVVMATGEIYVFENGKLTEIKPKEETEVEVEVTANPEMEALKAELEAARKELADLKAQATELSEVKAQLAKIKSEMVTEKPAEKTEKEENEVSDLIKAAKSMKQQIKK